MNDSTDALIIGVDGGGTGCRAAIGTAARGVLGQAKGGRANVSSDPDLAMRNVMQAIEDAAQQASIPSADLSSATVHLGLAGVHSAGDSAKIISVLPHANITVTDDRVTTIAGALGGRDGYLLSIGTGTIAAASTGPDFHFVSGWGFQISDQASGAWLGRAALEQVILCHDGLDTHTELTKALLAKFDNDPTAIVSFAAHAKPGDFATFAPKIVTSAHSGDAWAKKIMTRGAEFLVRFLTKLGFAPGDTLCLTGGVGPHYKEYFPQSFLTGLMTSCGSALDGAFQLAQAASIAKSEETQ